MARLFSPSATSQTTRTFPVGSSTFVVPAGVTKLDSIIGQGGVGSPGSNAYDDPTVYYIDTYRQNYTWDGTTSTASGGPVLIASDGPYYSPPTAPTAYCDPFFDIYSCYAFFVRGVAGAHHPGTSPSFGPSATGFGQTFAGGYGGAASPSTINNVAVTPLSNYSITVPSGGSITITYTS